MPLIFPSNTLSAGGFSVDNSCRFDDGDSAYLEKSASAGNRKTFTISAWVKRGNLLGGVSGYNTFFSSDQAVSNSFRLTFSSNGSDDKIMTYFYTGSQQMQLITNAEYRDVSAWYHVVVAVDTTQGTEADRTKLYVNGVQETSFSTETYPSQDLEMSVNQSGAPTRVGAGTSLYFDGYIAEFCLIDGLALAPTSFGEFDEDSPTIWKPIDVSGLTFGTNGFYLDFEDSANLGNDANGGTDLTDTNLAATDQATDTPTNNFATWNPLVPQTITFAEGNTEASASGASWKSCFSTIGFSSGKWYFETTINSLHFIQPGIMNAEQVLGSEQLFMDSSGGYSYHQDGAKGNDGNYTAGYGDTFTTGDTISVAFDADNGTIWFGKDGAWQNSATEGEIEAGTTTNAAFSGIDTTKQYLFAISLYNTCNISANFGSPAIAITSGNADDNGYGDFEYAVPSGYYALCTKNLATYG